MKIITVQIFLLLLTISTNAQQFTVHVSSDTVLVGNILNITFTANNIVGQFEGPVMQGLNVISGPNTSTSMSMINGDVTHTATYSYGIVCEDIGDITILSGYLNIGSETLETEPFSILVLPNPEGIIEQPPSNSGFYEFSFPRKTKKPKVPPTLKKKKRLLKKI